ncbi:MAG: 1-acyl-sn-glycerol-3-phosphate acyltransferase [Acidimicrobiia bacterium]|nr:1-acyl-sn-glycerol-3-phosphate acyltransferase [Acidimicrobiia bacterium]
MIPVRRERAADLPAAFDQVRRVLDDGGVVGIFPEGTRSGDGMLHRGLSGAAHLALTTGAPVVPVGIVGTHEILPTGARLVRPFHRAALRPGEPISPAALGFTRSTNRARRELTDTMMREIGRLSGQEYVDDFAEIPGT